MTEMSKYLEKIWLNKNKYMALMEDCLVVVTVDDDGNEVRWAIFGKEDRDEK